MHNYYYYLKKCMTLVYIDHNRLHYLDYFIGISKLIMKSAKCCALVAIMIILI